MPHTEIERKFLLKDCDIVTILQSAKTKYKKSDIIQAYLEVDDGYSKRVRKDNDSYTMTIKEGYDTLQRKESEEPITQDRFEELLHGAIGIIEKTRYRFESDMFNELCVDIFISPVNFIVAEIEYKSIDDAKTLDVPQWLQNLTEKEVTRDKRYLNSNIAIKGHQK